MKHHLFQRPAAAGLAVLVGFSLCAAPIALAQLKKAPSPEGTWDFKTAELNDKCTISGEMTIGETGSGDTRRFTCRFKAVQACTGGSIRKISTEQSCTLTQAGPKVTIISKVERIVATEPPELMKGMDRRYFPDNFYVSINTRGDEMEGMFESQGEAPVKFRRKGELIS